MTCLLFGLAGVVSFVSGQVPDTLRHSFYAPKTQPQKFCKQGACVAVDGGLAAIGAPMFDTDDTSGMDCGAVRIHETATGALLHELKSSPPVPFGYFGQAVALSGSRVAVGSDAPVNGAARAGKVDVFDLASATPTVPIATLAHPDPAADDLFGHAVAIHGDLVVVGVWRDDDGAENAGSAFVYDLGSATPTVPLRQLKSPSPDAGDTFGVAVGVAGSRVIVAAYGDDSAAANAGAVYVFDLDSSAPDEPSATWTLPGAGENDGFGNCLSVSGTTVAIGAEGADAGPPNAGKVAVFDLDDPAEPPLVLTSPAPQADGYFGTAVSLQGNRLVVGEYRHDSPATDAGACHVFDLAGTPPQTATHLLKKAVPAAADYFGNAVAVSGDLVLVGAFQDDSGDSESGSSYLFDLTAPAPLVPVMPLNSPVTTSADHFGTAVAISGDRVVVGAPDSESGATGAGRVRLFDLASSDPKDPVATFENPSPAAGDRFGAAVAISGGVIAVGSPGDDTGAINAGCVQIFDADAPGLPLPTLVIANPEPGTGDEFGQALALHGDLLVVGAAADDGDDIDSGRAYVFDLGGATPATPLLTLNNPSPAADDRFGTSVSIRGNRVAVGAPGDDAGGTDSGRVYGFDLGGTTPGIPTLTADNPSAAAGDGFGTVVALSPERLVASSPGDDSPATDAGAVHVFQLSSPAFPEIVLQAPVPAANDRFGNAVAISGSRVVVGAALRDGPTDSGRVFSFNLASPTPGVPSATNAKSSPASGDHFGAAVAVEGTIIVIGTPSDNRTDTDKGAAYIFGPAAPEIAVTHQGLEVTNGETADFGAVAMGGEGGTPTQFTIRNTGITGLAVTSVTVTGGDAADFVVATVGMASNIPADDDTVFSVELRPAAAGARSTTLRIGNSDSDESPFLIQLTGFGLSADDDTDGDGLNDVAELRMAGLGFDWQTPDPELVETFQIAATAAGFFPPDDIGTLHIPAPGISKSATGFRISLSLGKSSGSGSVQPLPFSGPDTGVNPAGEVEFEFSDPGGPAFYKLETGSP